MCIEFQFSRQEVENLLVGSKILYPIPAPKGHGIQGENGAPVFPGF